MANVAVGAAVFTGVAELGRSPGFGYRLGPFGGEDGCICTPSALLSMAQSSSVAAGPS